MSLQALKTGERRTAEEVFKILISEEIPHKYWKVSFTERTLKNYSLNFTEHEAIIKNQGRITEFMNIWNNLSLCADPTIPGAENFHSVDDVSILVDSMTKKAKVLLSTEAVKFLQEHKLSIATNQRTKK